MRYTDPGCDLDLRIVSTLHSEVPEGARYAHRRYRHEFMIQSTSKIAKVFDGESKRAFAIGSLADREWMYLITPSGPHSATKP